MWSSRSRRQLSTQRSAIPFCQGLAKEVRTGLIFMDRTATGTSNPYFASRSKIRNLSADSNGNASRSCWMIQRGRRALCDVEVQDPPATMADHEKTIDYAEGDGREGEEIHRSD